MRRVSFAIIRSKITSYLYMLKKGTYMHIKKHLLAYPLIAGLTLHGITKANDDSTLITHPNNQPQNHIDLWANWAGFAAGTHAGFTLPGLVMNPLVSALHTAKVAGSLGGAAAILSALTGSLGEQSIHDFQFGFYSGMKLGVSALVCVWAFTCLMAGTTALAYNLNS